MDRAKGSFFEPLLRPLLRRLRPSAMSAGQAATAAEGDVTSEHSTHSDDLIELAKRHATDKWGAHFYCTHYDRHFAPFRHRKLNLLEIGIGGYADPAAGGQSLRMWRDYFPLGAIYGLDIHDKSAQDGDRIQTFVGSQADPDCIKRIVEYTGGFDLIVDDGSHHSEHVIASFTYLFPHLRDGGIYAIEDLETSYWRSFGGATDLSGQAPTSMNFLKRVTDGLNFEEFDTPGYQPSYFDRNIVGIHFYHNMCFIEKGSNSEGSIWVKNNILDERIR